MNQPIIIRVRDAGNTYIATCGGMRATATAGREQAARNLAERLYPGRGAQLFGAGIDYSDNAKGAQHCYRVHLPGGDGESKSLGPKNPPRVPGYRPYA